MKMVLDPVCGMEVDIDDGAVGPREREGHQVWFCSYECLGRFDEDPDRFEVAEPPRPRRERAAPPVDRT